MSAYFTHPFVLLLWSMAIATASVFVVLTLSNWSTYRALRTPALRIYCWFTLVSAVQALCVVASLLPMSDVNKTQIFRLMWLFGSTSLSLWVWSVMDFAELESRLLRALRWVFMGVAAVSLADLLFVAAVGGGGYFYYLEGHPQPSIVLLATGNVLRHAPLADVMSATVVLAGLVTSGLLVWSLSKKPKRDIPLLIGVILTPLLFGTEAGLILIRSKYNLPLVFLANLVEAARISWASRDNLFRELSEIREQRERQTLLIEGQLAQLKVDQRLANVGEQTARLSHDLRNPLTAVIAGLELTDAALREDPPDPDAARQELERVKAAVKFTLSLVTRITLQAKELEEPMTEVRIAQVVRDSVSLCAHRLDHIAVRVKVQDDTVVCGRYTELVQVLVNLITNACDAIDPLPKRWISIEARQHRGQLDLRVSDSGPRPPVDVVERMFVSRFTTGTKETSTGLGLTIVAQIVRQHRGQVQVDRHAENTTIVLSFPLSTNAASKTERHVA